MVIRIKILMTWLSYALQETQGHEGAKPQRVAFCGNLNYLFTCGFSRMSARQYAVWNAVSVSDFCDLHTHFNILTDSNSHT